MVNFSPNKHIDEISPEDLKYVIGANLVIRGEKGDFYIIESNFDRFPVGKKMEFPTEKILQKDVAMLQRNQFIQHLESYDRGRIINDLEALKVQMEIDIIFIEENLLDFYVTSDKIIRNDYGFTDLKLIKEFKDHTLSLIKNIKDIKALTGTYFKKYSEDISPKLISKITERVSSLPFIDEEYQEKIKEITEISNHQNKTEFLEHTKFEKILGTILTTIEEKKQSQVKQSQYAQYLEYMTSKGYMVRLREKNPIILKSNSQGDLEAEPAAIYEQRINKLAHNELQKVKEAERYMRSEILEKTEKIEKLAIEGIANREACLKRDVTLNGEIYLQLEGLAVLLNNSEKARLYLATCAVKKIFSFPTFEEKCKEKNPQLLNIMLAKNN